MLIVDLVVEAAVDQEDRRLPALRIARGDGVHDRHCAEAPRLVRRAVELQLQGHPAGEARGHREREEGGLAPRGTTGFGHDRRDDVHELGQARGGDAVGMADERDQQTSEHDGIHDRVRVLEQARSDGPLVHRGDPVHLLIAGLIPDVPLVERDVDRLVAAPDGLDVVGCGDDRVDEAVHVHRGGQEAGVVALERLVVGVARDEVDVVIGLLQDDSLPRAEGRHLRTGTAAHDQLQVGIDLAHRPGGLGCELRVVLRRAVAELPRPVHLVAQTPHPHVVRLSGPVGDALVRELVPERRLAYSSTSSASCTPRVPRLTAYIISLPTLRSQTANSSMPTSLVSVECQARSSRRGRSLLGPTPSSQR